MTEKEIVGKYNVAKVYTDNIEQAAYAQVLNMMNQKFAEGSSFAIMPDCHAGAGCVIGLTMKIVDKVVPNLVGVDIQINHGRGITRHFRKSTILYKRSRKPIKAGATTDNGHGKHG